MIALVIAVGLGAIYLTGRGIYGGRYPVGRFLTDIGIAAIALIAVFLIVWVLGGPAK